MDDFVIPEWAKHKLVGLTIASVDEIYPHNFSLKFTDGSSLDVVGMPFRDGTLDVTFIEGLATILSGRT